MCVRMCVYVLYFIFNIYIYNRLFYFVNRKYGVLYVNASVEIWNPYLNATNKTPDQLTLYWRHLNLRKRMREWGENDGPTAILDHGPLSSPLISLV
jgi:homospermidine synthase